MDGGDGVRIIHIDTTKWENYWVVRSILPLSYIEVGLMVGGIYLYVRGRDYPITTPIKCTSTIVLSLEPHIGQQNTKTNVIHQIFVSSFKQSILYRKLYLYSKSLHTSVSMVTLPV